MIAEGTRVTPAWLGLREPADAAARAPELVEQLAARRPATGRAVIHDLGCGTGAMGRWLAPLLPGPQRWVVHDRDADLLEIAAAEPPGPAADGAAVTVEARRSDVTRLHAADLAGADLITSSALLDLLTGAELARLVAVCAGAWCPVLLTLSVVGRVALAPADPLDARVAAAFDAHQRRTTAWGRLLGPNAVAVTAEAFGRLGADVVVRPSPWRLGAALAALTAEWLDGWVGAACEQEPDLAGEAAGYLHRRLSHAAAGRLEVTVGHADLLILPRAGPERAMSRALWTAVRIAGPVLTLGVVVWRVGTGPFRDGVHTIDARPLAAAVALAALTTVCCAWRWRIVARGFGIELPLPRAVAAYYRSVFLNVTLSGGIVGDVHRGISHGRDVHDVGRGLRVVAWERSAGQVVQAVLTVACLLALPSPVRSYVPLVVLAVLAATLGLVLVARAIPGAAASRWHRLRGTVADDVRNALLARRAWPGIAVASAFVVAGQAVTFLIAARTAGVTAPASRLLPLALLAMLAMVLPSIGGWGPREGVTAWVFGAAGLGAERGVETAVVYGVMVLVASLPGAAVLVLGWLRRRRSHEGPEPHVPWPGALAARPEGGPRV